ncbi:hypothetical protein CTEN210_02833 [Chaetoceros tenuissimus]|uniref:Uncharacterized protein n=1 Tax=Chaetoceros tenuissimus TaxID=426638 RepID=A0AAD3CIN6_9STRA|nr:hypothetical protein CTEN210_02833 [Chaetoceros tenuissimus]
MTSLTQEILDLEMQLKCIREGIIGDWKDEKCRKDLMKAVQSTKEQLVDAFGQSLHRLGIVKPKEKTVETLVQKIPDTMKVENKKNRLPIHSCIWVKSQHASKYIPLLAREGMKHNIGGEEARGGLLTVDPSSKYRSNTLQLVANMNGMNSTKEEYDEVLANLLKVLRKEVLLKKEDVLDFELIRQSAWKGCARRFKYLLTLDPKSLQTLSVDGKSFMHFFISRRTNENLDHVKALWTTTLELFPEQAGYLFQIDANTQQTAVERAIEKCGEKEIMEVLHDILSQSNQFPILHHALVHAPKLDKIFMKWFPWAYNLRDHHGRSLVQCLLAAGAGVVRENVYIFASMSDDQIRTKDPKTTLYPFAAVASGEEGDLEKSFYLLRRQPGVLEAEGSTSGVRVSKKRKRDEGA